MKRKMSRIWLTVSSALLFVLTALFASACGAVKYTLTFETDGGTQIAAITAEAGAEIAPPANPEKEGFTFDGWYLSADFSGGRQELPTVMPEENRTYYAKYAADVTLTLDVGEGTLAQTVYKLKVGTNLLQFLEGKEPTAEGLVFGGWFNGKTAVSETAKMPAGDLTLTSRYKAQYTVEVYEQNFSQTGYDRNESADFTASYWVGEKVNGKETKFEGFDVNTQKTQAITLQKGENTLTVYLDRTTVTLSYQANLPLGVEYTGAVSPVRGLYGATVAVTERTFAAQGYRFAGWSTTPGGAVEYQANDEIILDGQVVLYAVWDIGYTDMLGGSDVIYLLSQEEGVAVLMRRGMEEKRGTYDKETGTFSFTVNGTDVLTGKVNAQEYTFAYYDAHFDNSYYLYVPGETPINFNVTLTLDGAGGATVSYAEDGESFTVYAVGTYEAESLNGEYLFSGLAGSETVEFAFRLLSQEGAEADGANAYACFAVCGEERGEYMYMILDEMGIGIDSRYLLTLDGYGNAVYVYPDASGRVFGTVEGSYVMEETGEVVLYFDALGTEMRVVTEILYDAEGTVYHAYIPCDEAYEFLSLTYPTAEKTPSLLTFEGAAGSITVNGYTEITYTDGNGKTVTGSYFMQISPIENVLVTMVVSNSMGVETARHYFKISPKLNSDGEPVLDKKTGTPIPQLELVNADYGEYLLLEWSADGQSVEYMIDADETYLVLDGNGGAKLYTMTCLFAEGTYAAYAQENAVASDYVFTATKYSDELITTGIGDEYVVEALKEMYASFRFKATEYYVEAEGAYFAGFTVYNAESEATLAVTNGGMLFFNGYGDLTYTADGESKVGVYESMDYSEFGVAIMRLYVLDEEGYLAETLYFLQEYSGEANLYCVGETIGQYIEYNPATGEYLLDRILFLDGKGGVIVLTNDVEEDTVYPIGTGVYESAGEGQTYTFTSSDGAEEFVFLTGTASVWWVEIVYYIEYNADWAGLFAGGKQSLSLDGYGNAVYTDTNGVKHMGTCIVEGDYVEVYAQSGQTFGFDLDRTDNTFTVRGPELGKYRLVTTDGTLTHVYIVLDGLNNATLEVYSEEEEKRVAVAWGSYEKVGRSGESQFTLKDGSLPGNLEDGFVFVPTYITVEGAGASVFLVYSEENDLDFYANDWSVLLLDGFGTGTYIDRLGKVHFGSYNMAGENVVRLTAASIGNYVYFQLDRANAAFEVIEDELVIENGKLLGYQGSATDTVTLPASVTEIGVDAFAGARMTQVVMPGVTVIGVRAFEGCIRLRTVVAENLLTVGDGAFYACRSLTQIDLSKVTDIGAQAFEQCVALCSFDLSCVRNVGVRAFAGCGADADPYAAKLETVVLPAVEKIGAEAFFGCIGLQAVAVGDKIVSVGARAFMYCSQDSTVNFTFGAVPSFVGASAFEGTDMRILVESASDIFALYESGAWGEYTVYVCVKNYTQDGVYFDNSLASFVFNGIAINAGKALGYYEISAEGAITVYCYDGTAENGYTLLTGEWADDHIVVDGVTYQKMTGNRMFTSVHLNGWVAVIMNENGISSFIIWGPVVETDIGVTVSTYNILFEDGVYYVYMVNQEGTEFQLEITFDVANLTCRISAT